MPCSAARRTCKAGKLEHRADILLALCIRFLVTGNAPHPTTSVGAIRTSGLPRGELISDARRHCRIFFLRASFTYSEITCLPRTITLAAVLPDSPTSLEIERRAPCPAFARQTPLSTGRPADLHVQLLYAVCTVPTSLPLQTDISYRRSARAPRGVEGLLAAACWPAS